MQQYDSIIMSDVLHYLQPADQKMIIEKCVQHLLPGGVLIIRDGNKDLAKRHKGTQLTETFSTKILGFNKTSEKGLSFLSAGLIWQIAREQGLLCRELDATKFTSNIIFVLNKASVLPNG
jgi:2-polyprenyl-3-methyl-5-hydroxy-6-metoxy-1,4-benzoquinol methylase